MLNLINPNLPIADIFQAFSAHDRVEIKDFLKPQAAEDLKRILLNVSWNLAYSVKRKGQIATSEQLRLDPLLEQRLTNLAWQEDQEFKFSYHNYDVVAALKANEDPNPDLIRLLEYLNAPEFHRLLTHLTGFKGFTRVSAQATWYKPGDFLTVHDDFVTTEHRYCAYVLSLSEDWHESFGGNLHLLEDDKITEKHKIVPSFNTLTLFKTPQQHLVSRVASTATGRRVAITGWLSKPAP